MSSIKRTTTLLFALRLISMALSVMSVILSAKFFGVSIERDSWILALSIITTISLALWGPLNETFRTKFVYIREMEGSLAVQDKVASLIGIIIWITVSISVLMGVCADFIANIMLNADTPKDTFVKLFIIIIPTLLISQLSKISTSILNAYEVYYIPEYISMVSSVAGLIIIWSLSPYIGIYSMVVSTYVGAFLLLAAVVYILNCKHINIWYRIFHIKRQEAWPFIIFSLPFFFPYLIAQFNFIVEKYLAGILGAGMVSTLDYSRQFTNQVQSVLLSVLTTIMVPMLSKAIANKKTEECSFIITENLQICFLILTLALSLLIGASSPLCDFFFNRGKVTPDELQLIISLTRYFGIAFIGVFFYIFWGLVLLSSGKNKYYATIGVFAQIIVAFLNIVLINIYSSLYVFPLTFGVAHFICGTIMFVRYGLITNSIILQQLRGLFAVLFTSIVLLVINMIIHYQQSLIMLLFDGCCLLFLLPISATIIGFNVKVKVLKIRLRFFPNK